MSTTAMRSAAPMFPGMGYEQWRETLATLHRFVQVVGKVRLAASPRRNHWWNVPFHLTGRGITTRPMGWNPIFCVDFDFHDHRLDVTTSDGARYSMALPGLSVAQFYERFEHGLASVGVQVDITIRSRSIFPTRTVGSPTTPSTTPTTPRR